MRILGISGLANAVSFKKQHWPSKDEREYRISQGHDAAAALVVDGRIVAAAAEERFNLKKHSGDFPSGSINYCLQEAGIQISEVDQIVHSFDYAAMEKIYSLDPISMELYETVLSRKALLERVAHVFPDFLLERVRQVPHHLAHAGSAYFTSGWEECLVLVIDAMGGKMEFGPRALGNRSILADPADLKMRDRINAMVKKREAFRPFAPAVSIEEVHRWFDVPEGTELPFMIATVMVRKEHRASLPAITHVDGSARVQTVSRRDNPDFHVLLQEVGKCTGREMLLNTSFNVKGQPIVNSPREAITTFLGTGIDFLFLENCLLYRRETDNKPS